MHYILDRCCIVLMAAFVVVTTTLTCPLIYLAQKFLITREWYYSHIFGLIAKTTHRFIVAPRETIFESVNKALKTAENGKVIKVLEIGPGTGTNFKYYKSPIELTTIDQNPLLEKIAQELAVSYPLIHFVSHVANAENMTCFEDNSFDFVCATTVMCCIEDNAAVLREIHRVLKPKGRYYYMEGNRMQSSRNAVSRFVEKIFSKFWIIFEYGCKFMHNNFDEKLKSSQLVTEWNEIYRIPECPIGHEVHYGCATKI